MNTITKFIPRQYTDADAQAVCDLLNLCDKYFDLDDSYTVDDLRLEFEHPDLDKTKDIHLWEDENERLVGFGQLWIAPESNKDADHVDGPLYWRVHPEAMNSGLESQIIEWATERTKEVAATRGLPVQMGSFVREHYTYGRTVLEENGFVPVRYFLKMGRPLNEPIPEPQFPEGYTLRHVASDEDRAHWVEMYNQSFIDHWNFHPATEEGHNHWLESSKYLPERDLIAVAPDGTFAAFCLCWIDPEDNERNARSEGWIDVLGTRRGYRKIGLGRAMLLAGLHRLRADGMDTAVLGVDAENPTGALGLYESVGFGKVNTSVAYRKELE